MPWNSRLTGLQPGDGVYHPKFGLGLVLSCESFEAGDERGQVRFQWHGVKWMALSVAPMCRIPEELAAECRRQSAWKATLQQPTREAELELLLAPAPVAIAIRVPSGLRWRLPALPVGLLPVSTRLPQSLPWASQSGLVAPLDGAWVSPGWYASRKKRAGRRHLAHATGQSALPMYVCSAFPSFKRLRHCLADAVQAIEWVGPEVVADVLACWGLQPDTGACVVDLTEQLPGGLYRYGTRLFLNRMRERMVFATQQLRATSHANGRWWPAPECLQVLLNADGTITARMRFAAGYQRPDRPWLDFIGKRGWR